MMEHVESGACIHFVDECEFKVSVPGQRKLERNRSAGFCLEPNCAEIMQEYYIVVGKKLKVVNFSIFITVSTKSLWSLKSTFY